jgi:hypothetical protein
MKIKVTKKDIEGATRRDCEKCAVAIAIKRLLKAPFVWVDNVFHIFAKDKEWRVIPAQCVRVADRIGGFDNGVNVDEFEFEMEEWKDFYAEVNEKEKAVK